MSTLHVMNGSASSYLVCNSTRLTVKPPLNRDPPSLLTPTSLSLFGDSDRCLKEINYPKSFCPIVVVCRSVAFRPR